MFDEIKFKNRVIELINSSKHQREGVGLQLVTEFNLSGKHTVTRKIQSIFGISLADMLKLRFTYPNNWEEKLPNHSVIESKDIYSRVMELRALHYSYKTCKNTICKEFNLTEMELLRMARSIFQKTLSEVFEPTKNEVDNALLRSNTVEEFKELLGLPSAYTSGVFEKYYGKSNFINAKASIHNSIKIPGIVPSTEDNESIIFSQVLGDGSYDSSRGAIRIAHGIKQLDYLKLKVGLIYNAYPNIVPGIKNIKTNIHTQGHEYCSWYSTRLPNHVTNKLANMDKKDLINSLTPLGWYLWFLDDGNLHNGDTPSLSICAGVDMESHRHISKLLSSKYNINGNAYQKYYSIQKRVEIVKFLNTFIKPFSKLTPECMVYKTQFMI